VRQSEGSLLSGFLDAWIARYAKPKQAALDAVAHLKPAVVVTGGSRGIGFQLARRFAKAGYDIAVLARNQEPLQQSTLALANEFPVRVIAIVIDVTGEDAPATIDARLAEQGLYSDILVNCAGVGLAGNFTSHDEAQVMRLIEINVAALTRLMHHTLPRLIARGRGGILNVASVGGLVPGPYQAAYYASKAYVISLTEAVGTEIAGLGVRMCVLAPGPVNTGFHQAMGTDFSFYRQLILPLSAQATANAAYRGYVLGCRLVVPGIMNKLLAIALKIIPHALLMSIVGWLLRPAEPQSASPKKD
jgi:short-subunit dehydrogenase